jgi:hypothetical protein
MTESEKLAWFNKLDSKTQDSILNFSFQTMERFLKHFNPEFIDLTNRHEKFELDFTPFLELNLVRLGISNVIFNETFSLLQKKTSINDLQLADIEGFKSDYFNTIFALTKLEFLSFYNVQAIQPIPNLAGLVNLKHFELVYCDEVDLSCLLNT